MSPPHRSKVAPRLFLLPFAVVAALGLFVLLGWWLQEVSWVLPRPYDPPLPANAALCLLFLAVSPTLAAWRWTRTAVIVGLLAAVLGGLTLIESVLSVDFGLDNLLVRHEALIDGVRIGRMNAGLAFFLGVLGLLLAWSAFPRRDPRRPVALALAGSLTAAYGLTGALAGRIGLGRVEFWHDHAHLGLPVALALLVLGTGTLWLAAGDPSATPSPAGPRWLWLPVVVAGVTVTVLFWISLQARELAYLANTTQLTINTIATVCSSETGNQIDQVERMAARWTASGGAAAEIWEADARAHFAAFPAYQIISRVSASARTQWLWPRTGNEDVESFDHAGDPVRRRAMEAARNSLSIAVAAPLTSPMKPPAFAVYAPFLRDGRVDGFVAGEFGYQPLLEIVDRRLNISQRYQLTASVWDPLADNGRGASVAVYGGTRVEAGLDERLRQSAAFNVFNQRLTLQLVPRPGFGERGRNFLPELALASGLGVSALLGLVVNLAQAARLRQRAAESTAEMLRSENEERRRVEGQLKMTDDRLNLALDSTQVGVYEWAVPTGQVIYSPSVWNSLGYDPAAMPSTAQAWLDLMHPEDVAGYQEAVDAHFRGETPFIEPEFRMRHQDGEWNWLAARAKCVAWDAANKPLRVTGTCQNITARRRAEEALRASQAAARLLTHVARRTANVVFITTPAGNIEWTNDSFTRLTGYAANEVTGVYLLDLLSSPDNVPQALDEITQALLKVEPITNEVVAKSRHNDQSYHLRLELQPVKNDQGVAENFIAIGTDITTNVQTELTLRNAKAEADAASRAKSEFLATMSHEIRTPMNGVIGMTSLLLETPLTPEQLECVSTIRTSGNALLEIINEILDFSKIESGRMELELQPFELAQCVEEAIDIFALQAAAKNIELSYRVEPTVPPWILLDMTRVRQVLVNLVNNAVKFTVQGQITIEVRPAMVPNADPRLPPGPHQEGGRMMIDFYVRDTGIGIPRDRRHLLFKPFSQVDSSTTRKYGGTGLGLAICDRLCHLMGGTIDVEDSPDGGSVFHFSILAAPVEAAGAAYAPLPGSLRHARVLVVDDLPFNRIVLRQALARLELDAVEAAHLHDGTEIAMEQPIVAAIIDNELLGETGATLAEELRLRHPDMPVILLTNPIESAKRADSSDPRLIRLPKPLKPGLVIDALHRRLSGRTPVAAPASPASSPASSGVPLLAKTTPLEVLIVEDNPVNQKVALRFLERLGYSADAVGDGLEALGSLDQRKYDLVFMDLQMPEMDGITATREIRRRYPAHRQPRIVALTANAVEGDRERCLGAGMDDYLSKPVKLENIQQVILKFFRPPTAGQG